MVHFPTKSFSRQYAFDDPDAYGEATDEGKRFRRVLHQVKEPLGSITSLCTEPLFGGEKGFIQRHIKWESSRMENPLKSRACLEMVGFAFQSLPTTVPSN